MFPRTINEPEQDPLPIEETEVPPAPWEGTEGLPPEEQLPLDDPAQGKCIIPLPGSSL